MGMRGGQSSGGFAFEEAPESKQVILPSMHTSSNEGAPELVPVSFDKKLQNEAERLGLAIPNIDVDPKLSMRLARKYQELGMDTVTLFGGVRKAEIEHHTRVVLLAREKGAEDDSEPVIDFDAGSTYDDTDDTVYVSIDPTPSAEENSEVKANTGLWAGVLLSSVLGDRAASKEKLEEVRKKLIKRSHAYRIGAIAVPLANLGTRLGVAVAGYHLSPGVSIGILLAQIAGQTTTSIKARKLKDKAEDLFEGSEEFEKMMLDNVMPLAELLAKEFPVLSYGLEGDDEALRAARELLEEL